MSDDLDLHNRLAAALREARRAKGLSLEAVAKLSGVSRSMVSQIERGESSPTVATLWNLTRALQVDFAGLLEGKTVPAIRVVRGDEAPVIQSRGSDVAFRILSAPEDVGVQELYDVTFGPQARLLSEAHHAGCREDILVIRGSVGITSGSDKRRISAGDAANYAADVPHCLEAGTEGAQLLMIVRGG